METGQIVRSIQIAASRETVFEVITSQEHLKEWWPDDAELEPTPGTTGRLIFGDPATGEADMPEVAVVEAEPPRLFSFRWMYPDGDRAKQGNSLLVTFELAENDGGTLLRMTETGFRENGWEVAELEEQYRAHVSGWDFFLPQLVVYAPTVQATGTASEDALSGDELSEDSP